MSKTNSWLTIDRLNGKGNATVALTVSELSTVGERNLSLKVKTLTKSSEINVLQKFYEEPLIPENIPNNQIWAKSTDGSEIPLVLKPLRSVKTAVLLFSIKTS